MKTINILLCLSCLIVIFWQNSHSAYALTNQFVLDSNLMASKKMVNGDTRKIYFLIKRKISYHGKHGLLLILPGGSGSEEFMPFCANTITAYGTPQNFITAELIAPVWNPGDTNRIVWPSKFWPDTKAKFTTEDFINSVISDVTAHNNIDSRQVFILGWSSSGSALYSAAFSNSKIHGAFIAMSRFDPFWIKGVHALKGKPFYFWHSTDDAVCPFIEVNLAQKALVQHGALVQIHSYPGGHGWQPYTYYCDRIKEAIEWMNSINNDHKSSKN